MHYMAFVRRDSNDYGNSRDIPSIVHRYHDYLEDYISTIDSAHISKNNVASGRAFDPSKKVKDLLRLMIVASNKGGRLRVEHGTSTMRHWDSPAAMYIKATTELFTLLALKIQPVETLAGNAFQSRPHNISEYIHNETLGQSSSNGLDEKVLTVTDLAFFSTRATADLFTLLALKIQPVETLDGNAFHFSHITSLNISTMRHWDSPAAM
eukprot:scaffold10213_cov100-Cyclotella_meneghiniana.AAC.1